jgi:hypothetical protein
VNYSKDTKLSGVYSAYAYTYANMKKDDGKIDSQEVAQLIPILRRLAEALGNEKYTNINLNAYVME